MQRRNVTLAATAGVAIALLTGGTALAAPGGGATADKPKEKVVFGSAAAPSAAVAHPTCPSGYHCVFYANLGGPTRYGFFNSDRDFHDNYFPNGQSVNDNTWSASNSSTGGYESHYWYHENYNAFLFCVNPGHAVDAPQLTDDGIDGNSVGQRDEATSMSLRGTTSIRCF